jgi:hypothetical protein
MQHAPIGPKSGAVTTAQVVRLAPYMILGPISGPLTAGVVVNFRGGRPFLASMYGFLLTSWLLLAPLELIRFLPVDVAHFF